MSDLSKIKAIINEKVFHDIDWMNPYWLDKVKDEYPEVQDKEIDKTYKDSLQSKINAIPLDELNAILSEQNSETSANQNYLLQHLIEEKLGLNL